MANQGEEDPASELSLKLLDEELASMEIEAKQLEKEGEMELAKKLELINLIDELEEETTNLDEKYRRKRIEGEELMTRMIELTQLLENEKKMTANLEGESMLNENEIKENDYYQSSEDGEEKEEEVEDIEETISFIEIIKEAGKLKLESFIKTFLISVLIILLLAVCIEKDFSVVSIITSLSNSNHFYVVIVIGILLCFNTFLYLPIIGRTSLHIGMFFVTTKSLNDLDCFLFFSWTAICWVFMSISTRLIFPNLTGKYYEDDGSTIEKSPDALAKVYIFILLFLSNFLSQIIANILWHLLFSIIKPEWLPPDLQPMEKRNIKDIALRSIQIEGFVNIFAWFLFFLIIGIGSASNIPSLNQDVEIFIFGYLFPFVKAAVVSVCYNFCMYFSDLNKWSPEHTSRMTSTFSSAAVIVITLSQLNILFRSANDHALFLYQYIPHEIIKKLSWLTFHPMYLKIKMQVIHIVSLSFMSLFQRKAKVDPSVFINSEGKRRFTKVIILGLNATGGEIIGRQFGEDLCMILMAIWMLPICQEYLFTQIYQTSSTTSSLPFPSYNDILTMIVGTAYGLETILTIACFVILQRVGIPLTTNTQVMELNVMMIGNYVFTINSFLLILVATFIY